MICEKGINTMGVRKQALKLSEWRANGDEFRYEGSERKAHMIIIGMMEQPGGTESYIAEGIYDDIMPLIEQNKVTVHVDIYSEPMVVIEKDGRLVPHNINIQYLKEDVCDVLDESDITKSNQIRTLVELRNNIYASYPLGRAAKILRMELSRVLDLDNYLNYDFLSLVLREKYSNLEVGEELAKEFRSYTKEELISVYGGLMEKALTNAVKIEPAKELVEKGIALENIEEALKDEVARRFFYGEIK